MKKGYMIKGFVFLVLSFIGLLIPVIPQVPFFLLAMTYFSKGNRRFSRWINDQRAYRSAEKMMRRGVVRKRKYAVVK